MNLKKSSLCRMQNVFVWIPAHCKCIGKMRSKEGKTLRASHYFTGRLMAARVPAAEQTTIPRL